MKTITVKLNGREFPTYMDDNGVQRYVENPIISRMLDGILSVYNHLGWQKCDEIGLYSLNNLAIDYQTGNGGITLDQMLDFYTSTGYSVSGMADLSYFEDVEIENPLWD